MISQEQNNFRDLLLNIDAKIDDLVNNPRNIYEETIKNILDKSLSNYSNELDSLCLRVENTNLDNIIKFIEKEI